MNIENAINKAVKILKDNRIKNPRLDSEILMSKIIKKDRKFIFLNSKKKIEKKKFEEFKYLIDERSKGKPIAYITKKKGFWNYVFELNNWTLVPRPDSELIIEEVLELFKNKDRSNVLDIGVGSGCLLLTILKEKKKFLGTGIDISKKCIELSKLNAMALGLINRVKFCKTDVDNFNSGKYDLIISNPPYVNRIDLKYLEKDIHFEPKLALDGGVDGLSEIRRVIKKSSELIKKNGIFVIEIGFDQKNKVKQLLRSKGFYINRVVKDYAKNDRCIVSTKI